MHEEKAQEQEHDHITHVGEPMKPKHYAKDAQRHMGTMEDNVSPVQPLTIGATNMTTPTEEESHDEHHTHRQSTPG